MRFIITFSLFISSLIASSQVEISQIRNYLLNDVERFELSAQDLSQLEISSSAYSKSMDAYTVYVTQHYNSIPVFNSSSVFVLKNNQVVSSGISFRKNISSRLSSSSNIITPTGAIEAVLDHLNIAYSGTFTNENTGETAIFEFTNESVSQQAIKVHKTIVEKDGILKTAWLVDLTTVDYGHMYLTQVDSNSGDILWNSDLVISCNFDGNPDHNHSNSVHYNFEKDAASMAAPFMDNARYNVYELPIESPNHGSESLIQNPANLNASPFGWHDTDGVAGPEFTITRGNNVYAQEDFDGDGSTFGAAPDGNSFLAFNFPQLLSGPAADNINGATVNLFYMNNMMHDIWYEYGFDEASGNFQTNNYGNSGFQNDFVVADAQDGSGFNNATFGTPGDGGNPRMNMFLWSAPTTGGVDPLTINNGTLAGGYNGLAAGFGSSLPNPSTPLTGSLTLVIDDNSGGSSNDTTDACDVITNGAAINGNIAVVRRGNCQFGTKVLAMQNQGAVAVIVVNNIGTPIITMGPGNDGDFVTIPSIMISQADGNALISQLQAGATINANLNNTGLFRKDGSLDNGIVAHEYGHGISTRLTGGALNPACLTNVEQMGEGWSDWFSLIITIEPGDLSTDTRGIGTYATNQTVNGPGIRNFPYSTDMSINPVTYGNTNNNNFSAPHGIGSIWASMLWDLSWRFIDDYGFDPDLFNGTGGNNIAMQLIMDGMKLQPCNPGFVDGRDAILQADLIANGGVNRDRIWEVFANRGLGLSAVQGSSDNRFDQVEAFDTPAPLSQESFENNKVVIAPNPSSGIFSIVSGAPMDNTQIKIYDFNGRLVFQKETGFAQPERINLSNLTSGVYLVSIESQDYKQVSKIIIQ